MYQEVKIKVVRREVVNRHKVPVKQWRKWTLAARKVFNEVYGTMSHNRDLFLHPRQVKPAQKIWKTTCWNAAWIAADVV